MKGFQGGNITGNNSTNHAVGRDDGRPRPAQSREADGESAKDTTHGQPPEGDATGNRVMPEIQTS
jgi:hypothetical protein